MAIASHVANVEGCELGQEVGFRIGQKSVASRRTCMMFTTAGLLMEELRANVREGVGCIVGRVQISLGYRIGWFVLLHLGVTCSRPLGKHRLYVLVTSTNKR